VSLLTDNGFAGRTGTYKVDTDCTGTMVISIPGGTVSGLAFVLVDYGRSAYAVIKDEHVPALPPGQWTRTLHAGAS
jgi:hypothetical protein